jgi:hypothetical protein
LVIKLGIGVKRITKIIKEITKINFTDEKELAEIPATYAQNPTIKKEKI